MNDNSLRLNVAGESNQFSLGELHPGDSNSVKFNIELTQGEAPDNLDLFFWSDLMFTPFGFEYKYDGAFPLTVEVTVSANEFIFNNETIPGHRCKETPVPGTNLLQRSYYIPIRVWYGELNFLVIFTFDVLLPKAMAEISYVQFGKIAPTKAWLRYQIAGALIAFIIVVIIILLTLR